MRKQSLAYQKALQKREEDFGGTRRATLPQHSALSPQPSTLNPQPSTLNPQPSTGPHQTLNDKHKRKTSPLDYREPLSKP